MALSLAELEKEYKRWESGKAKQAEMANKSKQAPAKNRTVPVLETRAEKGARVQQANELNSMQMANDLMASQKSAPKKNDMPSRVNKLNGTATDMTMPSPVNKLTNTPSANLDMQNKPSESLNDIKGGATWTKDTDTRYPKDTWKELSREELQGYEREARRIQAMGTSASMQDLDRLREIYDIVDENDRNKAIHNKATVDDYLTPGRRLSDNEQDIAKEIVDNYFKENPKANKLLHMSSNNANQASKIRSQMTEAERKEYEKMTALMNKTSNLSAYTYGMLNIMPFGNTAMDKMGEMMGVDPQYNYSSQKKNVKTQSPLAYLGGDMTSKLAAYSVANSALEKIPALERVTNGAGSFLARGNKVAGDMIGSVLRGNIADIALDTIPTEVENYKNGMRGAELVKDTAGNLLINTAMNGAFEAIPYLIKRARGLNDVADAVTPQRSQLEMEREALESSQNDMDALAQYLRENPTDVPPNTPTPVRPTNLEMEQASTVDNMDVLRQAMAEQEAERVAREEAERIAREQAAREVPRVGEEPSLVAKETPNETTNPIDAHKQEQLDVILKTNPALRDDVVWIRDLDDIKTFDEVWAEEPDIDPDFTDEMAQEAMRTGKIKVYSSYDIKNGTFVTPSYMEALAYAGTPDNVKSAVVNLDDVAWIDSTQGQLAKTGSNIASNAPTKEVADTVADAAKETPTNTLTDEQTTHYQKLLNDKKYFNNEVKKRVKWYKEQGFEMDKSQVEMELRESARRNLAEAEASVKNAVDTDATPNKVVEEEPETWINEDTGLNPNTRIEDDVDEIIDGNNALKPQEEYNIIEEAEDPGRVRGSITDTNNVRERGQSRHIRGESKMQMEDVPDEVRADFEDDPDMYIQLKNADTKAKAEDIYNNSNDPLTDFRTMLEAHDPAALPLGHQIAKDYSAQGNYEAAAQIYRDMGAQLTKAGQFTQASIINMTKNDPLTALEFAKKEIDKINRGGKEMFGDKWNNFKLTDDEIKAFHNVNPGDEEGIKAIYDQIGKRLAHDYPVKTIDKLLETRRVGMLFNPRTHIRNFGANIPTLGLRWMSDRVEAVGQNIAHIINPNIQVTQSVIGSGINGRKLATDVYNSDAVQALIKGTDGKYAPEGVRSALMENKQVFKGTGLERWIDKVSGDAFNKAADAIAKAKGLEDARHIDGGLQALNSKLYGKNGVQSVAETLRNTTYKLLDLGDSPFVRENFVERLGSYINAQGIKSIDDIPEEAITTAWEEAMKATYKDDSWAVQMLKGFRGGMEKIPGIGKIVGQGTIPFLQAPGNIAARMIDYSPIRGTKGIADIIAGASKNNLKQVTQGIEEFSKGATGSLVILLGMKLRESGVLTGNWSEDKDQKALQKRDGFRPFALHIGDKYFTYDWAQPFAEPLIIGTLLQDTIENSDKYDSEVLKMLGYEGTTAGKVIGATKEGAKASANSWFNASPMQSLSELLGGGGSGETDIAQNVFDTTVGDFASSFIPAPVNAYTKTRDTTQRNTYDSTNKAKTFINQQMAKLPGQSEKLPAKYDTWGEEIKYANSKGEAGLQRFVVPGEYTKEKKDPIDDEINRLFDETGDNRVFAPNSPYKVGDTQLDNVQNSIHQQDMGKRNRTLAETFINSDAYNKMDSASKVEILNNLYSASKAITERDKFGKALNDNSNYQSALKVYDEAGGGEKGAKALVDYYAVKGVMGSSDKVARAIYETKDQTKINKFKSAKMVANQYGKDSINETEWSIYDKKGEKAFRKEMQYYKMAKDVGLESATEGFKSAMEAGITPQQYAKEDEFIRSIQIGEDSLGMPKYLNHNETTSKIYRDYGEDGLRDYAVIAEAGGDKKTYDSFRLYSKKASSSNSKVVPSLDPEKYMQQVGDIEKYNPEHKTNGTVSQEELEAYMKAKGYTLNDARTYAQAFFGDEYTVNLTKKGKYDIKKKK